jgi:hypothetical protein
LQGRSSGTEFALKAANYIAAQWEEIGITPWDGNSYFKPFSGGRFNNLIGVIKGNHPTLKDEYIVVGAHYDHLGTKLKDNGEMVVYPGADDNASGTAVITELGRKLLEIQTTLSRSVILVAFDAEETGLNGSGNFVYNPPFPIEQIKLMFSVDMVGWYKTSGYVKYEGSGTIRNGESLLRSPLLIPEGLVVKTQNFEKSVFTATDTQEFAQHRIPTLAVTTGLKSPYHKPGDKAELIDYDGMTLITEHLTNVVHAFSADEEYVASGKFAAKHGHPSVFNFGITASFGSNHHHYTKGALDGKTAGAYGIGLSATINMHLLAIRPELHYNYIMAKHPDGKLTTHNLTVPLNIVLQSPRSSPVGLDVFVGPYYSYHFGGCLDSSSLDFTNLYRQDEMGINFGFEFRFAVIRIGVTSRHEYTNLSRTTNQDGAYIRNRSVFTTLSYVF